MADVSSAPPGDSKPFPFDPNPVTAFLGAMSSKGVHIGQLVSATTSPFHRHRVAQALLGSAPVRCTGLPSLAELMDGLFAEVDEGFRSLECPRPGDQVRGPFHVRDFGVENVYLWRDLHGLVRAQNQYSGPLGFATLYELVAYVRCHWPQRNWYRRQLIAFGSICRPTDSSVSHVPLVQDVGEGPMLSFLRLDTLFDRLDSALLIGGVTVL